MGAADLFPISDEIRRGLERVCETFGVVRLDMFGSAARPDFDPDTSDVDLLVRFGEIEEGRYADAYFELLEGIEALFGRRVDLAVDESIRNSYFREKIDASRTLLFAA